MVAGRMLSSPSLSSSSALRQAVAGAVPRSLMIQASFWQRQLAFVFLVIASVVAVYILLPYTSGSDGKWEFLSVAVFLLAVAGFYLTAKMLAQLDVETALVIEIETRAADYLRDVKTKQRARIDLDRLEETLLPNNPADPPPAMIRLFQHICKEAKDRRFDSTVNLTQPYREEALEGILRLQNLQKIALWLGILGTFIGMLVALESSRLTDISHPEKLLSVVQAMFGGLFVSFTASVAGLEVAVALAFALQLLRMRQEAYFVRMESAAVTMLSAARQAINPDDFLTEFSNVTTAVQELSTRVYEQTQEWSGRLGTLSRQIDDRTKTLVEGMKRLSEAKVEFEELFKGISGAQASFIADVRGVYQAISLGQLGPALEQGVARAGAEVASKLAIANADAVRQMQSINEAIDLLREGVGSQTLGQLGPALEQGVARAGAEVATKLATANADTARQIKSMSEAIDRFREAVDSQTQASAATVTKLGQEIVASSKESARAIAGVGERLQAEANRFAGGTQGVGRELQQLTMEVAELHRAIKSIGIVMPQRPGLWDTIVGWKAWLVGIRRRR
jgi:hypothetical protein